MEVTDASGHLLASADDLASVTVAGGAVLARDGADVVALRLPELRELWRVPDVAGRGPVPGEGGFLRETPTEWVAYVS